jgi:hypothetical protein
LAALRETTMPLIYDFADIHSKMLGDDWMQLKKAEAVKMNTRTDGRLRRNSYDPTEPTSDSSDYARSNWTWHYRKQ